MTNFFYWFLPLVITAALSAAAAYHFLAAALKAKRDSEILEQKESLLDAQRDAAMYETQVDQGKIEVEYLHGSVRALEAKLKELEPYRQNAEVLANNLAEANGIIRELRLKDSEYRNIDEKLLASIESTTSKFSGLIEEIQRLSTDLAITNAQLILEQSKNAALEKQVGDLKEAKEKLNAFSSASLVLRSSKNVKNAGALVYDRAALNEATS